MATGCWPYVGWTPEAPSLEGRAARLKASHALSRASLVRRKRARATPTPFSPRGPRGAAERPPAGTPHLLALPDEIVEEILRRLPLRDLAAASASCRALRSSVAALLPRAALLDLSSWSPSHENLAALLGRTPAARELRVDCWNVYRDGWLAAVPRPLERLELRNANFLSPAGCALLAARRPPLRALHVSTSYRHDLGEAQYQDLGLGVLLRAAAATLESLSLDVSDDAGRLRWDLQPLRLPRLRDLALRTAAPVDVLQRLPPSLRSLRVDAAAAAHCVMGDGYVEAVCRACPALERLELSGMAAAKPGYEAGLAPGTGLASLATLMYPPPLALVSDRALAALARLPNLRALRLDLEEDGFPCAVSDAGAAALLASARGLEEVALCGMPAVGDGALAALAAASAATLRAADFSRTGVTGSGLAALAVRCLRLARLAAEQCPRVGDDGVARIAAVAGDRLESLRLFGCGAVGDAGAAALATRSTRLAELDLRGTGVTDMGLAMLLASPAAARLERLRLGKSYSKAAEARCLVPAAQRAHFPRPAFVVVVPAETRPAECSLTDAALALLAAPGRCPRLRELVLVDAAATDWLVGRLARGCPRLESLHLVKCERVTGACLRALAAGPTRRSLRALHLRDSPARADRRDVDALRRMTTLRQVIVPSRETAAIPGLHGANRLLDVCMYGMSASAGGGGSWAAAL